MEYHGVPATSPLGIRANDLNMTVETVVVLPKGKRSSERRPRRNGNRPPKTTRRQRRKNQENCEAAVPAPDRIPAHHSKGNIKEILMAPAMSELGKAWCSYTTDPAGYHEKYANKPRTLCIPDGALAKGVSGEIRQINVLTKPTVGPDSIPLDGAQWSLHIISIGTLRLGYIAIASLTNEDVTPNIESAICSTVNDFIYPVGQKSFPWLVLHDNDGTTVPGWYWMPIFNTATASWPEPVKGVATTLDSWRTVGKSITCEFNPPTLFNQGYAAGGIFARTSTPSTIEQDLTKFRMAAQNFTTSNNGPISVGGNEWASLFETPGNNNQIEWPIAAASRTMVARQNLAYNGLAFAAAGDEIVLTRGLNGVFTANLTFTNSSDDSVDPIIIPHNTTSAGNVTTFYIGATNFVGEINTERQIIPLPPMNMSDIMQNDPNTMAAVLRKSGGIYAVQSYKTAAPVYEFANATSFAPINISTDGYEVPEGNTSGGIRDTVDPNVGTVTMTFKGISSSAQIVTKHIFMYEGMPSKDSTIGQFAETGGELDETALLFVANFFGSMNSVYAARDNFLGKLAGVVSGLLHKLCAQEATPAVLRNVANYAKDQAKEMLLTTFG